MTRHTKLNTKDRGSYKPQLKQSDLDTGTKSSAKMTWLRSEVKQSDLDIDKRVQ